MTIKAKIWFERIVIFNLLAGLVTAFIYPNRILAQNNWQVKGIDTQIVSKCWKNVPKENIDEQISLIKSLGANYVAVGTPYDRPDEMKKWVDSIHAAGLNVWFRSHWLNWEGDEGKSKSMSPSQYISKTRNFIITHRDFFRAGDAFTMNVEAENVGVGAGKPFKSWDEYRRFLRNEIDSSNSAFKLIGLEGKIHTNWLSMNGWIVENALDRETVDKMGLITVDHYPGQESGKPKFSSAKMAQVISQDLDRYYQKWNVPILIGEWGYYIQGEVSDADQADYIQKIFAVFTSKPYLKGANYWDHMGNQTRLLNDKSGSDLKLRKGALVLRNFLSQSK